MSDRDMRIFSQMEVIIVGAIELLKIKGWIQKKSHTDKGYCIVGAVAESIPDTYEISTITAVHDEIGEVIGEHRYQLSSWNDKWYRTRVHVLWVLGRTLKRIRVKKATAALV